MAKRRVVVTGLGMLSPLGNSVADTWQAVCEGKSGIDYIQRFDTEAFATKIGGEIKDFDPSDYLDRKECRRMDDFMQYGMVAGIQAVEDAGIASLEDASKLRVGLAIGSGIGGIETIEQTRDALVKGGVRKVSPFFVPSCIINMVAGNLAIKYGFKGPNIAIATACTTGTHNIGYAARTIAYGDADVMVAGGAEMSTTQVAVAGFGNAKALSTRNDEPQRASRPWDQDRDGFVLSDGAAMLVLEEREHAIARGAKIYGELVGFGMSGDAFHITSPAEDGEGAKRSMEAAITDAGLDVTEVDYINAHGTSTPLGDLAECQAVKSLFGEHSSKVLVSSTKSMHGHLLGAAGALEAIVSILAMRDNIAPPTINLENPSEGCDLDFVANQARQTELNVVLSNSFGFGGTNGTLVFKKHES